MPVETKPAIHGEQSRTISPEIEWIKCKKSLLYYLSNYVYIQDRVRQEIVKWEPWEHLKQLIRLVQDWHDQPVPRRPLFVVIFKSRQVGASTTISGIANWMISFFESSKVIEQSENERVALEMLERSVFINKHHPDFLRLEYYPSQNDLIGVPATNGKLITLPSTEDAGRSTDATMVVCDEWEKHRNAREGFAAVKPAMAKGGLFIGATTINKNNRESFPQEIYREAKQGKNGFVPLCWDYFVVPGRTEETWQIDTRGLADWQREGEYPRNEKEMLAPPKTTGYFNHDILETMLKECRDPVDVRYGGTMKIYTPPITNRKFVMAIDPSEGRDDPSVCIVMDSQTDEDVACFNGKMSLDEQAKLALELYKYYNDCLISVERNASGLTLIEKLNNLGVTNWYYSDKERRKEGWYTASRGLNRDVMLNELAEKVHLRRKRIPMKDCVLEFFDFAWVDGRPQAVRGGHDDWVMCEAQLGQIAKNLPTGGIKFSSFTKFPTRR